MMDAIAECECHTWVVRAAGIYGLRTCGRCGQVPIVTRGFIDQHEITACLHAGPCRR